MSRYINTSGHRYGHGVCKKAQNNKKLARYFKREFKQSIPKPEVPQWDARGGNA